MENKTGKHIIIVFCGVLVLGCFILLLKFLNQKKKESGLGISFGNQGFPIKLSVVGNSDQQQLVKQLQYSSNAAQTGVLDEQTVSAIKKIVPTFNTPIVDYASYTLLLNTINAYTGN